MKFMTVCRAEGFGVLLTKGCDRIAALTRCKQKTSSEAFCHITVCQDITDPLVDGVGIHAIIIDFSKAFDLVPQNRLITKLVASGVDSRVVVWVREFLVGRTQRVRVRGQLSKEVEVSSGVPQGAFWAHYCFKCTYIFGGTSTRILDSLLTTKIFRKIANTT